MSEEFAAIIELLQNAGVGTIWMFAGYLVYQLVFLVTSFVGAILVLKTICAGVNKVGMCLGRSVRVIKATRDRLKLGHGDLSGYEVNDVEKAINEMIDKK